METLVSHGGRPFVVQRRSTDSFSMTAVWFRWLVCGVFICSLWQAKTTIAQDGPPSDEETSEAEISELIQKLGASRFSEREKARSELIDLGLHAFDALYVARDDRDLEIRLAARDLLSRIEVDWLRDGDVPEVRSLMTDFGLQPVAIRRNRIESLAQIEDISADRALARVARFDSQERVAKFAALRLMQRDHINSLEHTTGAADKLEFVSNLKGWLGTSQRIPTTWLHVYGESLVDQEATLPRWKELIDDEFARLQDGLDEGETDPLLLRDLMRWRADLLYQLGYREEADETIASSIALIDGSRDQVVEAIDWLIEREAWTVIEQLISSHPASFDEDPFLLYHVAEVHRQLGRIAEADRIATEAADILGNDGRSRLEVAVHLQQRGLEAWGEVEFRAAIRHSAIGSVPDSDARLLLAELLAHREQYLDAASLLGELVDAVNADPEVEKLVRRKRDPKIFSALAHYYYSTYELKSGNVEEAWNHLRSANADDPNDPDILIAMYRIPDSEPEWAAETKKRIDTATGYYRDQIRFLESQLGAFEDGGSKQVAMRVLADFSNRYAWMVANTFGDLEEAIRCSERALTLDATNAAYHDTMARCCLANGDRDGAIRFQRKAVKLDPYSRPLRAHLEMLEASQDPLD